MTAWPPGELRLEGIEITGNPGVADIFVCPGSLALFRDPASLRKLRYFDGSPERHVFFDVSDHETQYHQPSIFIRCNLRPFNLAADPNSIQFPWPVEDYESCVEVPEGGFRHDVSFQGWISSEVRKQSAAACLGNQSLKCDIATYPDFCGYLHDRATNQWTAEGVRRRAEFRRSMKESRIALCPESIPGVFPYRFFEAMSAGRVPLLVGSDFVFPFADDIPYADFSVTCPRKDAHSADKYAMQIISEFSDRQLIEKGSQARRYWMEFLNSADWPKTMARAVEKSISIKGVA